MIAGNFNFTSKFHIKPLSSFFTVQFTYLIVLFCTYFFFISCTASKRYGEVEIKTVSNEIKVTKTNDIRVLLDEYPSLVEVNINGKANILNDENIIAKIDNRSLNFLISNNEISLSTQNKTYTNNYFVVEPLESSYSIVENKKYRGAILIIAVDNKIEIINRLTIEEYLKGVIAKEMPIGKGTENLEALKALTICARTYALIRMAEGKTLYDLYADTRDQAYGGMDAETDLTNTAVKESENLVLTYEGNIAEIYYHSTCGGITEDAKNVFTDNQLEYLNGVSDGSPANCEISPRFNWEEIFSRDLIVKRLNNAALIQSENYYLEEVKINSKFKSGRVNELEFKLMDDYDNEIIVFAYGNDIRQVLRTAGNKRILWSNFFEIEYNGDSFILNGKGFGHGVGLCQWGAISLSKKGWDYKEIINHYFPGIEISYLND